ncbi:hypothetical protein DL93DRAFT_2086921 [Clavulina sp. PMI_390]|nr:hypothetical protein DL93DRAFT_2086921 [Clavulina sp. PMI_390]
MAVWANLPSELATSVLYELDPTRYKTTYELWSARNRVDQNLLNCTYVSRQFRAIIEPLLYRKVHLPVAWKAGEDQISFRNVQQFTRTLVLRPELGKHVRELDIPCLDADYDENDDISTFVQECNTPYEEDEVDESLSAMSEPARGDLQQILPALARLGINNGLLLRGGGNGLLLVLLHLLPKLQKLELIARSELEFIAYSCFAAFVGGIPAGLSSISELTLGYEDTEVRESTKSLSVVGTNRNWLVEWFSRTRSYPVHFSPIPGKIVCFCFRG